MSTHGAVQVAAQQHHAGHVQLHVGKVGGLAVGLARQAQLEVGAGRSTGRGHRSHACRVATHVVIPAVLVGEAHRSACRDHCHRRHEAHFFLLDGGAGLQQVGRRARCVAGVEHHHGVGHGLALAVQHLDLDISGASACPQGADSYQNKSISHGGSTNGDHVPVHGRQQGQQAVLLGEGYALGIHGALQHLDQGVEVALVDVHVGMG